MKNIFELLDFKNYEKVFKNYEKVFITLPYMNFNFENFLLPPLRKNIFIPYNSILLYLDPVEVFLYKVLYLKKNYEVFQDLIRGNKINLELILNKNIYTLFNPLLLMLDSQSRIDNAINNINNFQYVKKISLYNFLNIEFFKDYLDLNRKNDRIYKFLEKDLKIFEYLESIDFINYNYKIKYLDGVYEIVKPNKVRGIVKFIIDKRKLIHIPQYVEIYRNGLLVDIIYSNLERNLKIKGKKIKILCGFEYEFDDKIYDDEIKIKVRDSNYYLRRKN